MIGTRPGELEGQLAAGLRKRLLKGRPGVADIGSLQPIRQDGRPRTLDDGVRGVEAPVEIHGGDHRLDDVGEDARALAPAGSVLTHTEPQPRGESPRSGDLDEGRLVHHRRPHLGHGPFAGVGNRSEDHLRRDQLENGVAEELQPLVGVRCRVFRRIGRMRERRDQHGPVGETMTDRLLDRIEGLGHQCTASEIPVEIFVTNPLSAPSAASSMALRIATLDDDP